MKLIKLAIIGVALAIGALTASTNVHANPPPRHLIFIEVDSQGYRTVWACDAKGCVIQDHYWTGESQQVIR